MKKALLLLCLTQPAFAAMSADEIIKGIPVATKTQVIWQERRLVLPETTHDFYVEFVATVMADLVEFGKTLDYGHYLDWRDLPRNDLRGKSVELVWVDADKFSTRKNPSNSEMVELPLFYKMIGQNLCTNQMSTMNYTFHLIIRNDFALYHLKDGSPRANAYLEMGLALSGQLFGYLDHFLKQPNQAIFFASAEAMAESTLIGRERALAAEQKYLDWMSARVKKESFPPRIVAHLKKLQAEQATRGTKIVSIDQAQLRKACGDNIAENN